MHVVIKWLYYLIYKYMTRTLDEETLKYLKPKKDKTEKKQWD